MHPAGIALGEKSATFLLMGTATKKKIPLLLEEQDFRSCALPDLKQVFPEGFPAIFGLCTVTDGKETVIFIGCCNDLFPCVAEVIRRPAIAACKPTHLAAKYHPALSTEQWAARATETVRYRAKYKPVVWDRD
jgi:hypothetical protein